LDLILKKYNMSEIGQIRGRFVSSNFSGFSNSLSSTTISATTFFGNISAKFIGTGTTIGDTPNFVTDLEFSYLSATTSNIQTQINTKARKLDPFLTYSSETNLTDYRQISAGTNINFTSSTTNFGISAKFDLFNPNIVYDTPTIPSNKIILDYFPNGWSNTYPNRATHLIINPTGVTQIFNLSANTFDSQLNRFVTITNVGNYVIILGGTPSSRVGKFEGIPTIVMGGMANSSYTTGFYLMPNKSVSFVWYNFNWYMINSYLADKQCGLDANDLFLVVPDTANSPLNSGLNLQSKNYTMWCDPSLTRSCFGGDHGALLNGYIAFGAPNNGSCSIGSFSNTAFQSQSGMSFLYTVMTRAKFVVDNYRTTKIFGTQNRLSTTSYTALTNNFQTIPNLGGGTFMLNDYRRNQNYWSMCVQTQDGSTIVSSSTLPFSALTSETVAVHFGLYTINPSGSSLGSTTFFWRKTSDTYWTIENEIFHTGSTINGNPSYVLYGITGNSSSISTRECQQDLYYMGHAVGYLN